MVNPIPQIVRSFFAAVFLTICPIIQVYGSTVAVSNIGQTDFGALGVGKGGGFNFQEAGSFTTGNVSSLLDSVRIEIVTRATASGVQPSSFNLSLYTGIGSTGPTGLVTSLLGSTSPALGFATYTSEPNITLDAFTTYWLVASAPGTAVGTAFNVRSTTSTNEDVGGLSGWTMGDTRWLTNNGGTSWNAATTNTLMEFSVSVTPNETPSVPDSTATIGLLGVALTGLVAFRRTRSI